MIVFGAHESANRTVSVHHSTQKNMNGHCLPKHTYAMSKETPQQHNTLCTFRRPMRRRKSSSPARHQTDSSTLTNVNKMWFSAPTLCFSCQQHSQSRQRDCLNVPFLRDDQDSTINSRAHVLRIRRLRTCIKSVRMRSSRPH